MEKEICIKCNDEFQLEPNLDAIQKKYCPYCRIVVFSEPDKSWLPKIHTNIEKRGRKRFKLPSYL